MRRGDVWMASLDPARGSEQAGTRPVLVLQSASLNAFLRTVVVVPLTSTLKWAQYPFCVLVQAAEGGLTNDSVALCHQIRVVDKTCLIRLMGVVSDSTLAKVQQALDVAVG